MKGSERKEARSALLLNGLQTAAILIGLVYGGIQLAQFRSEQRRQSKIELARSFMTPEFHEAVAVALEMPGQVTTTHMQTQYAEELPRVLLLLQTFEIVGILVFGEDLELATVDNFLGSVIIMAWTKLRPWITEYREENNSPSVAEWFQWLAERLADYRAGAAPEPAYEAYRQWSP